ncbi:hypothetical protein GGX14DRAFT_399126 [Mycena pura]|uniref:Uncharacterized protein n=1 Tax=Mycena pura TaxID=153505 RepID=A0AAD6V903_9AGAR|nr:hypothetical protein GGX14DRAFT_399126 [Mycena pura]
MKGSPVTCMTLCASGYGTCSNRLSNSDIPAALARHTRSPAKSSIGISPYPRGYTGFTRAGTGMGNVGYTRVTRGLSAGKPVPVLVGTGAQPPRVRVRVVAGIPAGLPVPMLSRQVVASISTGIIGDLDRLM